MSTRTSRSRWTVSIACVAFGLIYLVIGLARHQPGFAVAGLLIMLGYGAVLLIFGRRNEPIALLSGEVGDERRAAITLKSNAVTGQLLVLVLVIGFIGSLATGSDYTGVFATLCAIGGVCFIGCTVWFSRRG